MPTEGDTEERGPIPVEEGRNREADPKQDGGASDGGASESDGGASESDGGASDGDASEAGSVDADADAGAEAERETKIDAFLRGRHEGGEIAAEEAGDEENGEENGAGAEEATVIVAARAASSSVGGGGGERLRRREAVLRDFLAHVRPGGGDGTDDPPPDQNTSTEIELGSITPQDIVRWLSLKIYGEEHPADDARPLLDPRESLDLCERLIGCFTPLRRLEWAHGWDEGRGSGNPTRSREVRDLARRAREFGTGKDGGGASEKKRERPATGRTGVAAAKRARTGPGEDGGAARRAQKLSLARRELKSLRAQNRSYIQTLRGYNRRIDAILRNMKRSTGKGEKPAALDDGNQSFYAIETPAVSTGDCDGDGKVAKLAKLPKTLTELWDEYIKGSGGRKAAKDFNDAEREKVKSGYYRRNQFWSKVAEMMECGMTSSEAIDRIERAYGRKSLSYILDDLRTDRVRGEWPPLLQITDVGKTISASSNTEEVSSFDAIAAASAGVELSHRPKSLWELWQEYDVGLHGQKAVKDFTPQECRRGEINATYNKRKQFWSKVSDMVSEGMTADEAIDRVYQAYGRGTSVTTILLNMRRDKKNGWPLPLRADGEDHYLIARESDNSHLVAELSKSPKTLYDLWTEYTVGSEGRKPAKQFTSLERTRAKDNYYRRKKFWKKVETMIKNGMSSGEAIDRIYQAYGRKSTVSAIVKKLIKHEKGGGPALLQTNTKYEYSERTVNSVEV